MAVRLVSKEDGEVVSCRQCKSIRWLSVHEYANHYGKCICEKCYERSTQYYDPKVYKLEQVK